MFTLLKCPGELLVPAAAHCSSGASHRAAVPQRRAAAGATEAGSRGTWVGGGRDLRPRHPPLAADAKKGPPPASRPRASTSRSSRARPRAAEGEGRLRARPLLRRPNFPQLPQLSCALTVRLPGLPRGPSRSSSAPWPRRKTIAAAPSAAVTAGARSKHGGLDRAQALSSSSSSSATALHTALPTRACAACGPGRAELQAKSKSFYWTARLPFTFC